MIVLAIRENSIAAIRVADILRDRFDDYVWLPRATQRTNLKIKYERGIDVPRSQFPLALCWGITVDSSQSTTLQAAAIDLLRPFHSHGQPYVAFSRADPDNVLPILLDEQASFANPVNHLVFQDLAR